MIESDKTDPSNSNESGSGASVPRRGCHKRRSSGVNRLENSMGILRPLILGLVLGGVGVYWLSDRVEQRFIERRTAEQMTAQQRLAEQQLVEQRKAEETDWPPREFFAQCDWHYLKIDENGWTTGPVGTFEDLYNRTSRSEGAGAEIVIPIFPTVFRPTMDDKLYYDAILEGDIEQGDKVLVMGTGSGADAWAVSLKSQDLVYVVDINPMAIVSARVTAQLADFQIKAIVGDVREIEWPEDFSDFDFVLWNMPFLEEGGKVEVENFHDGDDGRILKGFLALLPSLLKKGGKAIVLNVDIARDFITTEGVTTKTDGNVTVFVIPNR